MVNSRIKQNVQSCFICRSRSNCIFSDLDRSRLIELEQMHQRSIYPSGAVLFRAGDQPQGVYIICSGRVKLSIYSSDGRAVLVSTAGAGNVFGVTALLSGKPYNLTAEALELTQVGFIKKDDFLGFLRRNGSVSLRLAQKLSNELYESYQGIGNASFKQSYGRLVELLLKLCPSYGDPTPKDIRLKINLSQEELADMIGTSRRTITRALTKLKHLGIIECQRRSITIRDIVALENILPSENLF